MDSEGKRYEFLFGKRQGFPKSTSPKAWACLCLWVPKSPPASSNLPEASLPAFADTYNVNLHWFLTGKGFSGQELDGIQRGTFAANAARWSIQDCKAGSGVLS
jgi:hypothetical protein